MSRNLREINKRRHKDILVPLEAQKKTPTDFQIPVNRRINRLRFRHSKIQFDYGPIWEQKGILARLEALSENQANIH